MARAIFAYNNSIHSTTGLTPLEFIQQQEVHKPIWEKMCKEKKNRIARHNLETEQVEGKIKVGDIVFKKNHYKRTKADHRFIGPFVVQELLSRNRLKLRKLQGMTTRSEIVHAHEIRRVKRRSPDN
ncbi:hypothetical protein LSTR_LSTR015414 [Laodelphax striatellus]|uniref:Integrase catalytic domain-containing protein n=1 Tax=Laodelphax striatellus TaxID=195883 RepID=A0A482WQZ4_LAOST|nr:hypothetical protein LSTR_LSTR015414 [Laodelphax striatellus]